MESRDISNIDDIKLMVDSFYSKIREDDLLGDIFNGILENRWEQHLEKMYRFWQTILFEEHTYSGSPFQPHATMPISRVHFDRWKKIFNDNMDSLSFEGKISDDARWRAEKMAELFMHKMEYIRGSNRKSIM